MEFIIGKKTNKKHTSQYSTYLEVLHGAPALQGLGPDVAQVLPPQLPTPLPLLHGVDCRLEGILCGVVGELAGTGGGV